ncbi:hypothetical protein S83_004271, partial [Arachis hypogaea]
MRARMRDQRVRGGHYRNTAAAAAIAVVEEGVRRREREKDDSQTRWRERTKTRREREGGCSAVHCRRSWGQLKPPPLLGLAVLLSSLSASTITSCISSVPFSTPRVRMQFYLLKSSAAISPDLFFRFWKGVFGNWEGGSWILTFSLLTCALSSLKNGCLSCLLLLRSSKEELNFPKSEGSLAGSINILSPAEFLKLNPLALIPILVDGDFVLAESLAIIMYLDDKYPQYPLLPHDVPKRALNFQVAHIVLQNNVIEKKVGPHEKLPWAQSVIRKGFTGDTSLNTIKIYSALEKLLKDHAGRYATEDEIFLCKITWRILIGVAVENVIRQPIPEVSNYYSCLVNNAGIGLGNKYPIGSKVQAVWSED